MKKKTTAQRNETEARLIAANDKLTENDVECIVFFEDKYGIGISDPTISNTGMECVDPETYYGDAYIKWYNSL